MAKIIPIPIGSIKKKQLAFYIKDKARVLTSPLVSGLTSLTTPVYCPNLTREGIAGETIYKGQGLAMHNDERWYISNSKDDSCEAVAFQYGTSGDIIRLYDNGDTALVLDADFTPESDVWLCSPAANVNLTTTLPTAASGYFIQKVGKAITTNVMIVDISPGIICD